MGRMTLRLEGNYLLKTGFTCESDLGMDTALVGDERRYFFSSLDKGLQLLWGA